ncbi:MAG: eCIS core domain-containing protein [Acidimicrobiales bacterium]
MRIERRSGAVVVVTRLVAPGAAAITLGRFVLVRPEAVGSARLLRHELVHVRQWRRLGVAGFLRRYLGAYARWRLRRYPHWAAYRRVPLEIEADWEARGPQEGVSPSEHGT